MNKKTMPVLLLIVGLIVGLIAGWLIFGGITSTGNAKAILNNSGELGDGVVSCSPLPHTCNGFSIKKCTTNKCITAANGQMYFDCTHCATID